MCAVPRFRFLGGTRVQIAGPTGAIRRGALDHHGDLRVEGLQLATLMAGRCPAPWRHPHGRRHQNSFLRRLSSIYHRHRRKFILSASAVISSASPSSKASIFHDRFIHLDRSAAASPLADAGACTLSLVLVVATPRIKHFSRVPGPLVAMIVAMIVQAVYPMPGIATIGSAFGGIPTGLPHFHLP